MLHTQRPICQQVTSPASTKLKVVIFAILGACGGVGTMLLANWLDENQLAPHFVVAVLGGLADAFLVAGLIGGHRLLDAVR